MTSDDRQLEAVRALFEKWGADEAQAKTMAAQLLKRAAQIARERKITDVEAAGILLRQVIEAREGGASDSQSDLRA